MDGQPEAQISYAHLMHAIWEHLGAQAGFDLILEALNSGVQKGVITGWPPERNGPITNVRFYRDESGIASGVPILKVKGII